MWRPEIRARFLAALRESAARGPEAGAWETILHYARPWGFDPTGATLTVYPGEGHAVDYAHIGEILATLAAPAPTLL